jgi:RNA polymerase sigma-70 factor, ECF subfamily
MPQNGDDLDLIKRARSGDRDAFDRLVREHEGPLRALISARLGNGLRARTEVEDMVQETLLRAFRTMGQFEGETAAVFRGWLAGIASNAVAGTGRKLTTQKADYRREVPLPGDSSTLGGGSPAIASPVTSPSGHLRREERIERLLASIERLSPDHRQVILLTRIEGLPVKEVATRMGRSERAVSMLLLRAMLALREVFGDTDSVTLPRRDYEPRRES